MRCSSLLPGCHFENMETLTGRGWNGCMRVTKVNTGVDRRPAAMLNYFNTCLTFYTQMLGKEHN